MTAPKILITLLLSVFAVHNKQFFHRVQKSIDTKPENLKKCSETAYILDWKSTTFSDDFNPGSLIDIENNFLPTINGSIKKVEFGIYFRDLHLYSSFKEIDVNFQKNVSVKQNYPIQLPRTLPSTLNFNSG